MNSIHFINVKAFSHKGAVDHKMVDSAVRKKPSKARSIYKVDSDKDLFLNWEKCKHLRYRVYSKKMEKDLSAYKWNLDSWI